MAPYGVAWQVHEHTEVPIERESTFAVPVMTL